MAKKSVASCKSVKSDPESFCEMTMWVKRWPDLSEQAFNSWHVRNTDWESEIREIVLTSRAQQTQRDFASKAVRDGTIIEFLANEAELLAKERAANRLEMEQFWNAFAQHVCRLGGETLAMPCNVVTLYMAKEAAREGLTHLGIDAGEVPSLFREALGDSHPKLPGKPLRTAASVLGYMNRERRLATSVGAPNGMEIYTFLLARVIRVALAWLVDKGIADPKDVNRELPRGMEFDDLWDEVRAKIRSLPTVRNSVTWQKAKEKAEKHLIRNPWPGLNALADYVGCSPATMTKARDKSPFLREKEGEYWATRKPRRPSQLASSQAERLAKDGDVSEVLAVDELFDLICEAEPDPQKGTRRR